MPEQNLNPDALEAAAKAEYPYLFNGKMEKGLASIERLFTPEQAQESAEKSRAEKIELIARHAGAYLSALPARPLSAVLHTAEELAALPDATVILDKDGDVFQYRQGWWCGYETADLKSERLAKYAPITVIHRPEASS